MKRIFLLLFFFSGIVVAQNHDDDKVAYLDFNQKPTSKVNAVYYEFTTAYKMRYGNIRSSLFPVPQKYF